jgi:hypothetical protein
VLSRNIDTLNIRQGDGIDTITIRLQFSACNGEYFDLQDIAIVDWSIDTLLINDTICYGDMYTEHGFNASTTGIHSNLIQTIDGCDSIFYYLDLKINDAEVRNDSITMCFGESYQWHGQSYTETGIYTFNEQYMNLACDSVRDTLSLFVVDALEFTVTKIDALTDCNSGSLIIDMPPGCYYTLNGERNAPTGNLPAGRYTIIVYNDFGCESLPQTFEIISEPLEFTVQMLGDVCGNESAPIIQHTLTAGLPSTYSLIFDDKALQAGFLNIENEQFTGQKGVPQQIAIQLPDNVRPNNYKVAIVYPDLCFDTQVVDTLEFTVLYAQQIITQRWNDVLSVVNVQTQEKLLYNNQPNSGDIFISYQWYKNGVKIDGAVGSYIYVPEGLDMNACYSVVLMRADDVAPVFTCEFCPVPVEGDLVVRVNPNPVFAGAPLKVETPKSARIQVFDMQGVKTAEYQVDEGVNSVNAPSVIGMYLYKITLQNGDERTFRISVK